MGNAPGIAPTTKFDTEEDEDVADDDSDGSATKLSALDTDALGFSWSRVPFAMTGNADAGSDSG
jgi:hypothetical protein